MGGTVDILQSEMMQAVRAARIVQPISLSRSALAVRAFGGISVRSSQAVGIHGAVCSAGHLKGRGRSGVLSGAVRRFSVSREDELVSKFVKDVNAHLPADGKGVAFASAWLVTDNVFVALMSKHCPAVFENMALVGVDTLPLFDGTYKVADEVQAKYGKKAHITRPLGVATRAEFNDEYGHCEELDHGEFDMHSKIEPFNRALSEVNREVLITGRRMDQGEKRTAVATWEAESKIFNPMADWSWKDVIDYADKHNVPVNPHHNLAFRCDQPIPATERHLDDLPWSVVDLGKPFWQCTAEEISSGSNHAYVFKSFGDIHTSVPVYPSESERTGRFVRTNKTECGIHT